MSQFETKHISPIEMKEEGFNPVHLFKTFNEKGEVIGFAELQYFGGKPSFYYIQNLGNTTIPDKKENGVASELILKVNEFLGSKKSIGYLANTSDNVDLYINRGWKQSKIAGDFNYYGEITEEEEISILERLNKYFTKIN